ncbi:MAG: hypothetical protein ACIALR_07825 [Blastopirellula sp. JB062]
MPRVTSLLPRLALLALTLTTGCAFPFFRSKDKSLEEITAVEAMSQEDAEPTRVRPEPQVADQKKPLPPIARFFGGLFGRGEPEPAADPISTIATPSEAGAAQPANVSSNQDVGAGAIAAQGTAAPPKKPLAANNANKSPTVAQPTPAAEVVNPHVTLARPQEKAPPQQPAAAMPTPAEPTLAAQPPAAKSGSLTSALQSAIDEAAEDGLAQESPEPTRRPIAAKPAGKPAGVAAPSQARVVDLSSAPITAAAPKKATPAPEPQASVPQMAEKPNAPKTSVISAATNTPHVAADNPSKTPQTEMADLASQPIGAQTPQTVYPSQKRDAPKAAVAKPSQDAGALVAYQADVHANDSIVDQLKHSRRVNEYRSIYQSESRSLAAQAAQPQAAPATSSVIAAAPAVSKTIVNASQPNPSKTESDALSQLVPSGESISDNLLEQPGSSSAPIAVKPAQPTPATPINPVRAVPRVAAGPRGNASSAKSTSLEPTPAKAIPQVATRPGATSVEPLLLSKPKTSAPTVSAVSLPKLAPVVSVEEYRRMQQAKRSGETTRY